MSERFRAPAQEGGAMTGAEFDSWLDEAMRDPRETKYLMLSRVVAVAVRAGEDVGSEHFKFVEREHNHFELVER